MTTVWHTYQPRLAGSVDPQSTPAARWLPTLPVAAHVVTRRTGYVHHGIYVGDARVVNYRGLYRGWRAGPVEEVSLEEFTSGRPLGIRRHEEASFLRLPSSVARRLQPPRRGAARGNTASVAA